MAFSRYQVENFFATTISIDYTLTAGEGGVLPLVNVPTTITDGKQFFVVLDIIDLTNRMILPVYMDNGEVKYHGYDVKTTKNVFQYDTAYINDVAELFDTLFGYMDDFGTIKEIGGLNILVLAGDVTIGGQIFTVDDTNITLTDNTISYVVLDYTDRLIKTVSDLNVGGPYYLIATIITSGGIIISNIWRRSFNLGDTGYQGYQGNQGPRGYQGTQGNQGYQGDQSSVAGPQGLRGYQGHQGYQGNQGFQGTQGYQGNQGNQSSVAGAQGNQGYQGNQSSIAGGVVFELKINNDTTSLVTGDGQLIFVIPSEYNNFNLFSAHAYVTTVSSSGLPTIQIRNITDSIDMLSTKITIDVGEFTSYTAVTPSVVDTAKDDTVTGDRLAIDVDIAGTGAKGLGIILTFISQ